MRTKMSGRHGNLKRRRGKCGSDKASTKRRTDTKRPKPACAAAPHSTSMVGGNSRQPRSPMEGLSLISCECHQSLDRRRCTASPQPDEQEGKENDTSMRLEPDLWRTKGSVEKREAELMDDGVPEKTTFPDDCVPEKITFPDDDSNQILPVEQFFGNLDVVQDEEYLQRPAATSMWSRREHRRQHFYAPEDSDEEEVSHADMQCDDRGGS